jgi:O-antigen/teichoic acid export membrane protein
MASPTTASASLPDPARALRRNFGWALGGRVVYGASQFALLVVLARLGDVTAVGAFAFALAFTAPPMVLANLQLRSLYATDVDQHYAWTTYVALRHRATAIALVLVLAALVVFPVDATVAWTTAWIALGKAFETASDLQYGVFQRHGRMDRFGHSLALRGIGGVLVVAAVLGLGGSMPWATAAMAAWWGLVLVAHDVRSARPLRPTVDDAPGGSIARLAWQAAPMGLVFLLDSLHQNIPRYFVEAELGTASLGLYTPMVYMLTIGSAFVFALGAPAAPVLARHASDRNAAAFVALARRIIVRGALLGGAGIVATALAGEWVLRVAYGELYAAESSAFVLVATAGAFHFVMVPTVSALTAARALRIQPVVYFVAIAAATGACVVSLPGQGLMGAAIASVAGMAAGTVTALVLLRATIRTMRAQGRRFA